MIWVIKMNTNAKRVIKAIVLAIICYLIARCTQPIYNDGDSYAISNVISGVYAGNVLIQFTNPVLCYLSYGLTKMMPTADGYFVILFAGAFLALCFQFYEGLSEGSALGKCIKCLLVSLVWFWIKPLNTNFTIQAAWFAVSGYLLLYLNESRWGRVLGTGILVLGAMIRLNAALLTMPFLGLIILTEILQNDLNVKSIRAVLRKYAIPLLCVLAAAVIQEGVFCLEPFESAKVYNSARSRIVDYPVLDYAQLPCAIDGVSEADFQLATSWVFLYDDAQMLDQFQRIAQAAGYNMYRTEPNGFSLFILSLKYHLIACRSILIPPLIILAATIFLLISHRARWYAYFQVLLSWMGSGVMILYFLYAGRCHGGVVTAIMLPCAAVTAVTGLSPGNCDTVGSGKEAHFYIAAWIPTLVLVLGAGTVFVLSSNHRIILLGLVCMAIGIVVLVLPLIYRQRSLQAWSCRSICNALLCAMVCYLAFSLSKETYQMPQDIFHVRQETAQMQLTDDMVCYTWIPLAEADAYRAAGKAVPAQYRAQFIRMGGWHYGQPYYHKWLAENGLTYPANDLLYRPNTYLLATQEQADLIAQSLREHYGRNVSAALAGEYSGTAKWQLVIAE